MAAKQKLKKAVKISATLPIEVAGSLLNGNIQNNQKFSAEELKNFYDIRAKYLEGKMPTYTIEEAHQLIRQRRPNP